VSSAFGGVIQDGASAHTALAVSGGTHVLTGNNTYTGGTTINNGTLQVGDDGTTGILGVGGVSGTDGTLAYDRSNALSESNTISGGVAVSQIGSGATTFTANNTYTGGTTISNGRLYANNATGSTGSGTVTVDSSGTIAGLGTVALSGTHGISLTGSGAIVPGGVQSGSVANGNLTIDTTSITAHSTILSLNGSSANPANNASLTFTLGSGVHMNANQEIDTGSQLVVMGPDGMAVANTIAFNVGDGAGNLVNINDLVGDGLVRNGEYVLIDGSNTTYTGLTLNLYPTITDGYNYGYQITGGLAIGSGAYDASLLFLKGDNIDIEVAPEPSTWALLLGSLALLALVQFRRRRAGSSAQ